MAISEDPNFTNPISTIPGLVGFVAYVWPIFKSTIAFSLVAYLRRILGQWGILLLNLTSVGFTNFFRCFIFDLSFFTNADVVIIKDETSKENS